MSKPTQQLFEQVKGTGPPEGVFGAVKEAVQAVAPGLSLGKILSDIGTELKEQGSHGSHELAAALFRGSDAFILYPRSNQADGPDHGLPDVQHEHARDGREM
jgi:hypothetical protein